MPASDFLVSHALENVWCQPIQDKQHLIEPARYTPVSGSYKKARIHRYVIDLPASYDGVNTWHHVYHIGRVYPVLLALDDLKNQWVRADLIAAQFGVQLNVFLGSGETLALCHCYLRRAHDDNILLAVEIRPDFNLGVKANDEDPGAGLTVTRRIGTETLYFRCYQSAKARSLSWRQTSVSDYKPVSYVYKRVKNVSDFNAFLNAVTAAKAAHNNLGKGIYFIDGVMVGPQTGYNNSRHYNRLFSYVHDEMIIYDESVPVSAMSTFVSRLDYNVNKMLVMVEGAVADRSINYHDDVDFYLYSHASLTDSNGKGVYIGRIHPALVRQVTQNSYGLRTDSLIAILQAQRYNLPTTLSNYYIRCVVRDGGMRKGLPFEKNRLNDLYLLPVAQIKQALSGTNAVLPEWRAENLEVSSYNQIMRSHWGQINEAMVVNAYGYHALSKVSFNELLTPVQNVYSLNEGYKHSPVVNGYNGCYLRYNANGQLINAQNILVSGDSYTDPQGSSFAEFFNLTLSEEGDGSYYNQNVSHIDLATYGFKAYACTLVNGIPQEDWYDITGSVYYSYTVTNGVPTITWNYGLLTTAHLYPAIKIGNKIHVSTFKPSDDDYFGTLRFSITTRQMWQGVESTRVQRLPSDTLLLFLNKQPLVENVDYYVNWPEVVIVKRPFTSVAEIEDCEVLIMHYGLATSLETKQQSAREVGFTNAGRLSANGVYDLRNDRNIKVIVDGRVYPRSQVAFAETSGAVGFPDGRPYSIIDYRLPLNAVISQNANSLMQEADVIDAKVSGYLTARMPQVDAGQAFIDGERYQVVSPLISALLHAMTNDGALPDNQLDKTTNKVVIEELIASYLPLLSYEPINQGASVYMVNILPHPYQNPMHVTALQYALLEYVIHVYLRDSVDLTPYVTIQSGEE